MEGKNRLDDFREWLSDNLRYFMLGGAILLVILVLFFSVRACARIRKGSSEKEDQSQTQEDMDSEGNTASGEGDGTSEPAVTEAPQDVPLEKNNEEITSLVKDYYKALGDKDIDSLRTLVKDLSPSDEARITNSKDFIEKYEVGDVYSQKGLTEDSYVVYACNDYIFSGVDTPMPALAKLYLIKDTDKKWKVDGAAWEDQDILDYSARLAENTEVVELISQITKLENQAQESDPRLAEFLEGLGDEVIVPVGGDSRKEMTVAKSCNVRSEPSTDAEVLATLDVGTKVQVLSEEGDWYKVEYSGETAYIFAELLE